MAEQTGSRAAAEELVRSAAAAGVTVAAAESCTGGLVGAAITAVSGSSRVYFGGVISYSNDVKTSLLGVDETILVRHGAVSRECAEQMAIGARVRLGVDLAVSVTGVAGPDGGSEEKPVGTVWIGLSTARSSGAREYHFAGDRADVRERSVVEALHTLNDAVSSG